MAAGDYQATIFPGTDSGIVDALSYAGTNGLVVTGPASSGFTVSSVWSIPQGCELRLGPGTYTFEGASGISVGKFATLRGCGYGSTSLKIGTTFSSASLIVNSDQAGGQQSCMLYSFEINGNKSAGAAVTQAIYLKGVGQPSVIRDVVVFSCSGIGIKLEGITTNAGSGVMLDNCWVNACNDHAIMLTGDHLGWTLLRTSVETIPANKAGIYVDGTASSTRQGAIWIQDTHIEVLAANAIGILLEDARDISIDKVMYSGSGGTGDLIKITGLAADSYNITIKDVYNKFNATASSVLDVTNGVTITNEVPFYTTGPMRILGAITAASTLDLTGNLTARGAANNFGTAGTAQATTVGGGGSGAAQSDLYVNAGSTGATKARWSLQRNNSTDLLASIDGTTEQLQYRHGLQIGTTAGSQVAYLTTGSKMRLASSGQPTSHLEVDGAIISNICPTLADNTTPTVADVNVCKCSPAAPTTITNFTNGQTGQIIYIIFTNANATITDGANMKLQGAANFVSTADDTMTMVYDGTAWFELARSVN